ncbi:MAG: Cof-type HAD-IIB family hydrolase, partial [Oscillospiraceae bacterium]|nr:Cof-type HAD-IIB family hydrolase [Oscillospiraceae bacterium]
ARFLERFAPDVFIGYGGALVLSGDEVVCRFDIPSDISSGIIKRCLATPEISSILAINESVALTNNADELASKDSSHYKYTKSLLDYNYSYLKISVNSISQNAVEKIAESYPMCDMLRYSGEDLYRFANRDALKWNAVKAAADYFHIGTDLIAAFGDDVNDLEMIKKCGIGVAVANAVDEAKAAADYICETNDNDGVAKWLEENA